MKLKVSFLLTILAACVVTSAKAHDNDEGKQANTANARYLANEAVLVTHEQTKVLFDPFFHNDYGTYQLVPDSIRSAIFDAQPPYDNVDAIVISHAHGDHFDAKDTIKFLRKHPHVTLVAPDQAIDLVTKALADNKLENPLISLKLELGDAPQTTSLANVTIESVRIPHAGWPQRKDVMNLVHRVTLNEQFRVTHMGDADPNDEHFKPFKSHWEKSSTDIAFPPYWFFSSADGPSILRERINAAHSVGVHVPIKVPMGLVRSGSDYFSMPGELRLVELHDKPHSTADNEPMD
jgi:L-ascorbate metabolism protein UlaG (beta-lactamase superfamily)